MSDATALESLNEVERFKLEFAPVLRNLAELLKNEALAGHHDLALSLDFYQMVESGLEQRVRQYCDMAYRRGWEAGRDHEARYWEDRLR